MFRSSQAEKMTVQVTVMAKNIVGRDSHLPTIPLQFSRSEQRRNSSSKMCRNNYRINNEMRSSILLVSMTIILVVFLSIRHVRTFTICTFYYKHAQQASLPITVTSTSRRRMKQISTTLLASTTIMTATKNAVQQQPPTIESLNDVSDDTSITPENESVITSEVVRLRMMKQLERLQLKDRQSPKLSSEELDIVFEDDHLIVVNKPAGVLSVAGKDKTNHSLVQAIYEYLKNSKKQQQTQFKYADHMVVHRLGMDISGLMVFAKTIDAVRGLHTSFRTRHVDRTYEILVCGHVPKNKGRITLPIMRDYEHPLYMRISTDRHQEVLIDLDPDTVGKKLLEQPKECITEYKVISREEMNGEPVTRLLVRSVSGRMHQINCHFAAIGHPLVGDMSYGGINGMASPNGGLSEDEFEYMLPKPYCQQCNRVSLEQQIRTTGSTNESMVTNPACHAKTLRFRHPITKKQILFESDAPF